MMSTLFYCAAPASSTPSAPHSACWASSCGSIMTLCRQLSQCSQARLPSLTSIAKWACFGASSIGIDETTSNGDAHYPMRPSMNPRKI
jgi:hypothetical protein